MSKTYNVNIVGNLTNNSGILDNFVINTNYALIPKTFNPGRLPFEWVMKFTTGSSVSTQYISAKEFYFDLYIYNGKICLDFGNGSSWTYPVRTGSTSLNINTTYWTKLVWNDGDGYKLYLSTDGTFGSTPEITVGNNNAIPAYQIPIGSLIPEVGIDFQGTVDLNECYIKINNIIWWQGVTTNASNLKIGIKDVEKNYIGNTEINKIYLGNDLVYGEGELPPTLIPNVKITGDLSFNNGVMSGFSSTSYAALPTTFSWNRSTWEFVLKVKLGSSGTNYNVVGPLTGNQFSIFIQISSTGKSRLFLSNSSGNWNLANDIQGSYTYQGNTDYYLRLTYDYNRTYRLYCSTDGVSWTEDSYVYISSGSNFAVAKYPICLGAYIGLDPFAESIDLKECYIKSAGNVVWQGILDS